MADLPLVSSILDDFGDSADFEDSAMDSVMDAGAKLVVRTYPLFRKETTRGDKDSDFNDLHRLEGLAEVRSQLDVCFDILADIKKHG